MAKIKPYSLNQCQRLVEDAIKRGKNRRDKWDMLDSLYRYGRVETFVRENTEYGHGVIESLLRSSTDTLNIILPTVNVILASVTARDPRLVIVPFGHDPDSEKGALQAEAITTALWQRADATETVRAMTKDAVLLGVGFCKTGWSRIEAERPRKSDVVAQELADLVEDDAHAVRTGLQTDPTPMDELRSMVMASEVVVTEDTAFATYVNPRNMLLPNSGARRLEECRWVAQRVLMPIDEVRANPVYRNKENIKANLLVSSTEYAEENGIGLAAAEDLLGLDDNDVFRVCELFEFYDKRTRTVTVFQLGSDKPLYQGDWPFEHDGYPFVMLRNYDDGEDIYSFGEAENLAPLAEMLNTAWTEVLENMRRAGNVYFGNRAFMDERVASELQSAEPDTLILLDVPQGTPFSEVATSFERAPLPADIYQVKDQLLQAVQLVAGTNDFMMGGSGADRMSATAASVVDGVASLRAQDKTAAVERACRQIGERFLALAGEFMDEPTAVRYTGGSETSQWVNVDPETLRHTFRVMVEGGSTRSMNPATRANRGLQLIQQIPLIQQAGFDVTMPLRSALRDMGYDPDAILQPAQQPEPAPQQAPQMPMGGAPGMGPVPDNPTMPDPALGGPPVIAGTDGEVAL